MIEFIRDICSWYPLAMYKVDGMVGIYPGNDRHAPMVTPEVFEKSRDSIPSILYDENRDFFSQFTLLFRSIALPGFHHYYSVENAEYSNHVSSTSHTYMSYHVTGDCERVMYSLSTKIHSVNVYNSTMTWAYSENVYQSIGIIWSSSIFYSKFIRDSRNIYFSSDLIGCSECIFCHDLENTAFAIENTIYSQEVYEEKKREILRKKWEFDLYYKGVKWIGKNIGSKNITGKYITDNEDVENGYYSHFVKNGKNLLFVWHPNGLTDAYNSLLCSAGSWYYGAVAVGGDSTEIYNCVSVMRSHECYYSYFLEHCSHCFGCIGLKNTEYALFNTVYEKDERFRLVWLICADMERSGLLGDFFPATCCPFFYEDTLAALMDNRIISDFPKDSWYLSRPIKQSGYPESIQPIEYSELWNYEGYRDKSWYIEEDILQKIIRDDEGNLYTIQPLERDFLIRHALPLPRRYFMRRIRDNFT